MFSNFRSLPDKLSAFVEKRPFLCILIVIVYIVSPIDLFPEGILGPIGYFDDALVAIAAVALLKRAAKSRLAKRKESALQAQPVQRPTDRAAERREDRRDDRPQQQRSQRPEGSDRRPTREQRWQDRRGGGRQPDNRRGDRRP